MSSRKISPTTIATSQFTGSIANSGKLWWRKTTSGPHEVFPPPLCRERKPMLDELVVPPSGSNVKLYQYSPENGFSQNHIFDVTGFFVEFTRRGPELWFFDEENQRFRPCPFAAFPEGSLIPISEKIAQEYSMHGAHPSFSHTIGISRWVGKGGSILRSHNGIHGDSESYFFATSARASMQHILHLVLPDFELRRIDIHAADKFNKEGKLVYNANDRFRIGDVLVLQKGFTACAIESYLLLPNHNIRAVPSEIELSVTFNLEFYVNVRYDNKGEDRDNIGNRK